MSNLVIVYSNKVGDPKYIDWGRLINIPAIEDDDGDLIFVTTEQSEVKIVRSDDPESTKLNIDLLFVNETTSGADKLTEVVKSYSGRNTDYNIYILIHDNRSKDCDQKNILDETITAKIINKVQATKHTDNIHVYPFWHSFDNNSRYPKIWPLIKECIDELCNNPVVVNSLDCKLTSLIVYLSQCNINLDVEQSQKELIEHLLNLAAYDLFMQSNVKNDDLKVRTLERAKGSIEYLKNTNGVEFIHNLSIDGPYSPEFHNSLKKLSSTLVKSYG